MIDRLMQSSVFWAIIGMAIAVIIAFVAVCFPLSKNINKTNQKKATLILSIVFIVILFVLGIYIELEYQKFSNQNNAKNEDTKDAVSDIIKENTSFELNSENQSDGYNDQPNSVIENTSRKDINNTLSQEDISTTLSDVNIVDVYNEDGYVINGIFGYKNYINDIFFKYNEKTNQYEGFSKSQIKCQLYETNLYFVDSKGNYLDCCNVSIGVPNAQSYSEMTYQGVFLNYNYKTSNSLLFQEGLYAFDIETIDGRRYSSDYIYINSEKDYYINVQQFL